MLFNPHKPHCEVGTELGPIIGEELETLRHSQGHVASRQEGQREKAECAGTEEATSVLLGAWTEGCGSASSSAEERAALTGVSSAPG